MIRPSKTASEVYLYTEPVDMRKQMNGLSVLVEHVLEQNPMDGSLFVFCNKQRDKIKVLFWEKNGFIIFYKRLEKQRFKWPSKAEGHSLTINGEELNWLIDGFDLWHNQPHKTLFFDSVS